MSRKKTRHLNAADQARLAFRRGDFDAAQHWTKLAGQQSLSAARHPPSSAIAQPDPLDEDGSRCHTERRDALAESFRQHLRRLGCTSYSWYNGDLPEGWKEGDPLPDGVECTSHVNLDHPDLFDYAGIPDDPDLW